MHNSCFLRLRQITLALCRARLHCSHYHRCILIVLYCIVLYCIVLHCIVLYCIVLYCIVLYCIILYYIVLYCIILYCIIVLYCIVLYYIVLYCIILYCIVLYWLHHLTKKLYISCPIIRCQFHSSGFFYLHINTETDCLIYSRSIHSCLDAPLIHNWTALSNDIKILQQFWKVLLPKGYYQNGQGVG